MRSMARLSCRSRRCILQADDKFGRGQFLNVVDRNSGREFFEHQAIRCYANDCEFRDDGVDDVQTGQRQRTLFDDFGSAGFGGVLHGDDDAARAGH